LQNEGCQSDGRRSVSANRLGDDLLAPKFGELAQNFRPGVLVGNDPELLCRSQWSQTRDRLLNHRLIAVKRQQLFGTLLSAQRPKACAPASGKNHGIEV
jgi:hypothetical protein